MDAPLEIGLRQKWRDHWKTRDKIFKPEPSTANRMGVAYFWVMSISLVFTALFVYLPSIDHQLQFIQSFFLKSLVWLIFAQLIINWGLCSMKDLSRVTVRRLQRGMASAQAAAIHPYTSMDDMPMCPACQIPIPPRGYHCKVCSMCVLKRDHHCYFTGSCVGFFNQRYFIVLTFYMAIGTAYATALIMNYACLVFPHLTWTDYMRYLPIMALYEWITGSLTFSHLIMILQLFSCVMSFGGAFGYFVWELCIVIRGQTSYEASRGINTFRVHESLTSRLRGAFGTYWLINFILPLPTLPEGSDGIQWQTIARIKGQ